MNDPLYDNAYSVKNKEFLKWMVDRRVLVFDPEYGFALTCEVIDVLKCSMDGKRHREEHKCNRCVNDSAIRLCAAREGIPVSLVIERMARGTLNLQEWREKAEKKYGWMLPRVAISAPVQKGLGLAPARSVFL